MSKNCVFFLFIVTIAVVSFVVPFNSSASTLTGGPWGGFICEKHDAVRDCYGDFPGPDNTNHQLWKSDLSVNYYSGFGHEGSLRIDVCNTITGRMWEKSAVCAGTSIINYGEKILFWPLSITAFVDIEEVDDFNHTAIHVRVHDATTSSFIQNESRRVEVKKLTPSSTSMGVGDSITVDWATEWAVYSVRIEWSGAFGSGDQDLFDNNGAKDLSGTFGGSGELTAQSTGIGTITLTAKGPGTNGLTPDSKTINIDVGDTPFLPPLLPPPPPPPPPPAGAHAACVPDDPPETDYSCRLVPGPGSNECSTDRDCNEGGGNGDGDGQPEFDFYGDVFLDANQNGVKDSGEAGLPNSTVYVLTMSERIIADDATDGDGYYRMMINTDIGDDVYIRHPIPSGYTATTDWSVIRKVEQNQHVDFGLLAPLLPTVTISANPSTVNWNGSSTISWSSTNATSCAASGDWSGAKSLSGTQSTGNLTQVKTYTYTLVCSGAGGSAAGVAYVSVSASMPTVSNVTVTQPNYCLSGPAVTISWTYFDPSGSPQSAYQVQITNTGNFNSPMFDSGKILSSSKSYFTGQGILQFNTTYKARARVWNGYDVVSGWSDSSDSWKTPNFAYPQVNFSFAPVAPGQTQLIPNDPVQFTDQTVFYDGNPQGRRWSWLFGDGGSSTQKNPVHSYTQPNIYNATLTATDNSNQSCSITKPVNIQLPNPIWKEVNPGG